MNKKFDFPLNVYGTKSDYLDPLECDSTICYKVVSSTYFEASVNLTDCNRKITWNFDTDSVEKVDRAIEILVQFRRDLVKGSKEWNKIMEKKKAWDEANKK